MRYISYSSVSHHHLIFLRSSHIFSVPPLAWWRPSPLLSSPQVTHEGSLSGPQVAVTVCIYHFAIQDTKLLLPRKLLFRTLRPPADIANNNASLTRQRLSMRMSRPPKPRTIGHGLERGPAEKGGGHSAELLIRGGFADGSAARCQ